MEERARAYINVYMILIKDSKILLSLRQNTGVEDGKWSLLAGCCEEGESAFEAGCREIFEEAGVRVNIQDMRVRQVVYRKKPDRKSIDVLMDPRLGREK